VKAAEEGCDEGKDESEQYVYFEPDIWGVVCWNVCRGARVEFGGVDYGGKDVVEAVNEKLVRYVDKDVDYPKVVEEGEPFVDVFALVLEVCLGGGPGELLEGGREL